MTRILTNVYSVIMPRFECIEPLHEDLCYKIPMKYQCDKPSV